MYLRAKKPKSKLIIRRQDKFSKQGLFMQAFERHPPVSSSGSAPRKAVRSRVSTRATNTMYVGDTAHKVDVANVIPAQTAGAIAIKAGLTDDGAGVRSTVAPSSRPSTLASM